MSKAQTPQQQTVNQVSGGESVQQTQFASSLLLSGTVKSSNGLSSANPQPPSAQAQQQLTDQSATSATNQLNIANTMSSP